MIALCQSYCALNDGSIFSVIIVVLFALSTTTLLTIHMGAGGKKGAIPAYRVGISDLNRLN